MLAVFALGLCCGVLAFLAGWFWNAARPTGRLVLTYSKPTGLRRSPQPYYTNDPVKSFAPASDYLVAIASKCGIRRWHLDGVHDLDADDISKLIIDRSAVTDNQFNCLARFVVLPNVQLTQLSQ